MPSSAHLAEPHSASDGLPRVSDRLERRRRQRVQMLGLVLLSYAVDTVLMFLFAGVGVIDSVVPWAYGGAGLVACGLFYLLLARVRRDGKRDSYLVIPQMMVNVAINLAFIVWVPQIGGLLLMLLFVIFAFGGLGMNARQVLVSTLVIAAAVGLLILSGGERISLPLAGWEARAFSGLWFALVLARSAMLGLYATGLRAQLALRNKQLAETFERLEFLANRDELTGALNRRSVMRLLDDECERMQRTGQPFGVAMLDIDLFKRINDVHGHLVGDDALRRFTVCVAAETRNTDRLGRYGGEEFLLLLTAAGTPDAAVAAADRMRVAVARHNWTDIAPELSITFSAGVAMCGLGDTSEQLLGRADDALYDAKRSGRNCVRLA